LSNDQLIALVRYVVQALTNPTALARLAGYTLTVTAVLVVLVRDRRDPRRYLRRPFRTDLVYGAAHVLPIYGPLVAVPLFLFLANLVAQHAPFLRLRLLPAEPAWLNVTVWVVVSDFVQYWLHRSMHASSWLWAMHKIHHSQRELNAFTTWRAHWLELVYLNLGNFAVSLVLGDFVGYGAGVIVAGVLAASQLAQHSDVDWSYGPFGRVIVNPRFHSWHHSAAAEDVDVNFGTSFVLWDHLFGTARVRGGLPAGYGLSEGEDDVPVSFLAQQIYPVRAWWRQAMTSRASASAASRSGLP
jgi:sterol desaturase/sphingolipid hydroxylase (fatty acid hydroxylase superfamily)